MIVLALLFLNHVYELVSSQLLLPNHLEKGRHFTVTYLQLISLLLGRRECRRDWLHLDATGDPLGDPPYRETLSDFFDLFVGEGLSPAGSSCREEGGIDGGLLMERGSFRAQERKYLFGLLLSEGLLFSLLGGEIGT